MIRVDDAGMHPPPAHFHLLRFKRLISEPPSAAVGGGFSWISPRNTTKNHKNISFLIFFWENIWWYIKFDISLWCQKKITNN